MPPQKQIKIKTFGVRAPHDGRPWEVRVKSPGPIGLYKHYCYESSKFAAVKRASEIITRHYGPDEACIRVLVKHKTVYVQLADGVAKKDLS